MGELKAGKAAVELIQQFEGLRLVAYLCPAQVWTIGWGHTGGVRPGMRITRKEADELLRIDLERVARGLSKVVQSPLTDGQRDAMISLCFNLNGEAEGLAKTAPKLLAKLNAGDYAGAAAELLDINRAKGRVVAGLTRRRMSEQQLFLS